MDDAPIRCTPIVLTDANGHVGFSAEHVGEDQGIGRVRAERENRNGRLLRQFVDRVGMVAINTWWKGGSGHTYARMDEQGMNVRKSRVDYILVPMQLYGSVCTCEVLQDIGVRLQNTRTALTYMVDHAPVRVRIRGRPYEGTGEASKVRRLDRTQLSLDTQGRNGEAGDARRQSFTQIVRAGLDKEGR